MMAGVSAATIIGVVAAILTSSSYIPQIAKCLETGGTDDLSWGILGVLTAGLSGWIAYGVLQRDYVIIIANTFSVGCLLVLMGFKVRAIGR